MLYILNTFRATCVHHKCMRQFSRRNSGGDSVLKRPWRVLFFGTDEFSLNSLDALCKEFRRGILLSKLEVVTGVKKRTNPIYQLATVEKLQVHDWPVDVAENEFDLGVVVSFGNMIPERLISRFPLGMINVHASLLPRWRGAAPIIYAIMMGDKLTGVSIMRIRPNRFDVGEILKQQQIHIGNDTTMPELSSQLSDLGARALIQTMDELPHSLTNAQPQVPHGVTHAPRVFASSSTVNWPNMTATQVFNLHRALTGLFPLQTNWHGTPIKLYDCTIVADAATDIQFSVPGYVFYHRKSDQLRVQCSDGNWTAFKQIGVFGKKPMTSKDFFNGFMSKQQPKQHLFKS